MVVIRHLAGVTLVSALVAGCAQSLFDANPARDGGGPPDRVDAGRPDAREDDEPDAGGEPLDCPMISDCVADAVEQFATSQGAPWRYMEVRTDAPGFTEMQYDAVRIPPGWTGDGASSSAIVNCDEHAEVPSCGGLADRLLLQPSVVAAAPRPALVWTARETGTYGLTIDWRLDDTQAGDQLAALLLARNNQYDRVIVESFNASTAIGRFRQGATVEIDAVQGDSIALALGGGVLTSLGVRFYISDLGRNDHCQMAVTFDAAEAFPNACDQGKAFVESGILETLAAPPPPGVPGVARSFGVQSLLRYDGAVNDYSGDWTLQVWAKLEGPGEVLSDISCEPNGAGIDFGGVAMRFDGEAVSIFVADSNQGTDCTASPQEFVHRRQQGFEPADWHLYRLVRTENRVDLCVDGESITQLAILPGATMVTNRVMELGDLPGTTPSSFQGQLADLRLYDRALPCLPGT